MKEENCILSGYGKTFHPFPDREEGQKWKSMKENQRTNREWMFGIQDKEEGNFR